MLMLLFLLMAPGVKATETEKGQFDIFLNGVPSGFEKYKIKTHAKKAYWELQTEMKFRMPWPKSKRGYIDFRLFPTMTMSMEDNRILGYEYRIKTDDFTNPDFIESQESATEYLDYDRRYMDPFDSNAQASQDEMENRVNLGVNSGRLLPRGNTLQFKQVSFGNVRKKEEPRPDDFIIIDAYTFALYIPIAERVKAMKGSMLEIDIVMPQGMRVRPGEVEYLGASPTVFRGKAMILAQYDVVIEDVIIGTFWLDKKGKLVQVSVPNEGLMAPIADYQPVPFEGETAPEQIRRTVIEKGDLTENDVALTSQGANLSGSFVTPKGDGPFPAVLLVQDLFPADRDGNKPGKAMRRYGPVRQLAFHLANSGFASLRTDAHGIGESGGEKGQVTLEARLADIRAQVEWLRKQPNVSKDRIVLLGYGLAGWVCVLASSETNPAALVGISFPAKEFGRLWKERTNLITDPETRKQSSADQDKLEELLETDATWGSYLGNQIFLPGIRPLISIEPLSLPERIDVPCLFAYPELDDVIPAYHAEILKGVLGENQQVKTLPEVNHLIQKVERGSSRGILSKEACQIITQWLQKELGSAG